MNKAIELLNKWDNVHPAMDISVSFRIAEEMAAELRRLAAENAELAAKLAECEKQEPVAETDGKVWAGTRYAPYALYDTSNPLPDGTKLYTRPAPPAVPGGYVLAPWYVTPEMTAAAEGVEDLYRRGTPTTWSSVYHAMLAAAPQPAQENGHAE